MKRFTAWRLQSRLLLSYLIVLAVGITVVAVGVQLVGPSIFDRALGEHMGNGRGAMHERMTAAQQDDTVDVFRTTVFQAVLVAALAATVVAVAASLFVARRIAGPVTAMARASRQMAAGQYNVRVEAVEPVELAELATSLNHLATALEEAEGRRVTLIGDVAHEIRTPLTTLRGNLEGLIDGIIEPSPELFATLHDETGRLTRLVDDLQQLSRVEAGDIALKIDRTIVRAAVDGVVTQAGASFAAKGVALRLELPAGLPRVISVGRLDLATEGLLLLTNDGELSRALELPSTALVRQYRARARGKITQEQLDKLKEGVVVDGVSYGPIEATLDKAKESKSEDGKAPANLWISVSITEGKNREVRKVLESVGLTVNRLIRLAYGPFRLDVLPVGAVEEVGPRVIREMLAEYIRPENPPTGNTVETPAPIPGRRVSTPIVKGRSGSAMSDPSRKPSRVRAAETAQADAVERRERPAKKEGWAKAAPKFEHTKSFKPRERTAPAGDRPAREDGDRPKRAFKPRDDQFIDDRRKPAGGKFGAGKPREGGGARSGGRDFKPRSGGKPAGPSGTSGRSPGGKPRTPR